MRIGAMEGIFFLKFRSDPKLIFSLPCVRIIFSYQALEAADSTNSAAKAVFDDFYAEITFIFENMNRKYDVDENTFLPTFEAYISEMGIVK